MPVTYDPIATTTLGSAAATITFSSIPGTYTDLRVVLVCSSASGSIFPKARLNNDTTALYSHIFLQGNGSTATTAAQTGQSLVAMASNGVSTQPGLYTLDIFSYAGSTNKTILVTGQEDANGSGVVSRFVNLYRSTSAITQVDLYTGGNNFAIGTTATLYGIKAA